MSSTLDVAPELALPLDAVTETFAILAVKRAGKSNAAVVIAERMYDAGIPWVAIDPKGDWWGVRAAGDGKAPGLSVLVFGGLHGDVPLEPTAGRLVADLIVEHRLTCVLDVSEMTGADRRRFLVDFAGRLYKENREPLHVFCEEADEYIPQRVMGENAKLVGAFETLVKRGGFRGIGVTLITQRSASLNKDVLTQAGTLIAMRTPSPQDRKAVLAWIDHHAASREVIDELPTLQAGEAWVFSPQWLGMLTKIRFHQRRTFDSGATPKFGEKPRAAARLADVDVDAITAAMAETIEKAKATDPKTLQATIARLERELTAERAKPAAEPVVEYVEVSVLDPEYAAELRDALAPALLACTKLVGALDDLSSSASRFAPGRASRNMSAQQPAGNTTSRRSAPRAPIPTPNSVHRDVQVDGSVELRSGARRMVEALGRMAPLRLTKGQWGTVAKLKTSGGTWSTYLSDIRRAGFLDEDATGYTLTDAGFDYLGGRPEPMDVAELQDHYRQILRSGAAKMFDALLAAFPSGLTREELGDAADIATTGGTFSTYLSDLVRNGLAERKDGLLIASDIVVYGARA